MGVIKVSRNGMSWAKKNRSDYNMEKGGDGLRVDVVRPVKG